MSDTHTWPINIASEPGGAICQWITDNGGPTGITSLLLFSLVQGYINQTQIPGYQFIPTSLDIFGSVQYWNDNITGGNTTLDCGF